MVSILDVSSLTHNLPVPTSGCATCYMDYYLSFRQQNLDDQGQYSRRACVVSQWHILVCLVHIQLLEYSKNTSIFSQGKMLLLRIVENKKNDAYFRASQVKLKVRIVIRIGPRRVRALAQGPELEEKKTKISFNNLRSCIKPGSAPDPIFFFFSFLRYLIVILLSIASSTQSYRPRDNYNASTDKKKQSQHPEL